jgi:hypothetical protein
MTETHKRVETFALLLLCVALGALLRATWTGDMEYKYDEQWMFEHSQSVGRSEPWPGLGMPSGAGLRNPGMSVWVFVALARACHATTPLQLQHGVVAMNVLAFVLLLAFLFRTVPGEDREAWLWAAALAAANPLSLVLQRKLWAQSLFPLLCVLFLMAWWRRDRRLGAAAWGFIGACLGQVHMSGFFFAASVALWTAAYAAQRFGRLRTRWGWWVVGSALGSVTLVPWVRYLKSGVDHGPPWRLATVLHTPFFRYLFSDALGLGLDYSLGGDYLEFLEEPKVGVFEGLYPTMYLHGVCLCAGLVVLGAGLRALWQARARWGGALGALGRTSETVFFAQAALGLYGLMITASGVYLHRHYLLITFPFEWLLVSLVALKYVAHPRRVLGLLVAAQLGLSVGFLDFIHGHDGAPRGDYGKAYRGK